jgi:hypothetical protein
MSQKLKIRSMRCQPSKQMTRFHMNVSIARSHDLPNDSALPSAVSFNPPLGYHIPISTSMGKEKTILGCRMEDGGMYWCGVSSRIVEPAPSSGDRRRIPANQPFGEAELCILIPAPYTRTGWESPPYPSQYPIGHALRSWANGVNTWFVFWRRRRRQ